MEDLEFLSQLWDFIKSVASYTIAPWVNCRLVCPTIRLVKPHIPKVRRVAAGQAREVVALLREAPRFLRNPWLWPIFLTITVGIGMEATRWAEMVEVIGGAAASVYACVRHLLLHPWRC